MECRQTLSKLCTKWIHKWCSDVLLLVGDDFMCKRCLPSESFCHLRHTIDGDGGADLAATTRIRKGYMKFRELLPFLTSRACQLFKCSMTYCWVKG